MPSRRWKSPDIPAKLCALSQPSRLALLRSATLDVQEVPLAVDNEKLAALLLTMQTDADVAFVQTIAANLAWISLDKVCANLEKVCASIRAEIGSAEFGMLVPAHPCSAWLTTALAVQRYGLSPSQIIFGHREIPARHLSHYVLVDDAVFGGNFVTSVVDEWTYAMRTWFPADASMHIHVGAAFCTTGGFDLVHTLRNLTPAQCRISTTAGEWWQRAAVGTSEQLEGIAGVEMHPVCVFCSYSSWGSITASPHGIVDKVVTRSKASSCVDRLVQSVEELLQTA